VCGCSTGGARTVADGVATEDLGSNPEADVLPGESSGATAADPVVGGVAEDPPDDRAEDSVVEPC
jgi:hypothetical protein